MSRFQSLPRSAILAPLLWMDTAIAVAGEAPAPQEWRICVSDAVMPPYLYSDPDRLGLAERLLSDAGRKVGFRVVFTRYSSVRCRAMLFADQTDVILIAPVPANLAAFRFPMKGAAVDTGKRLARINLVWIKRSDSSYEWDGRAMQGGEPRALRVGCRRGVLAIHEHLKTRGFQVDDSAVSTPHLMKMLSAGRVDLAVGLQEEVESALQEPTPQPLVVLPKSLATIDYFGAVRPDLPPRLQDQVDDWWTAIGRLRDRPEYKLR